jgi:hypothetical protein
MRTFIIASSFLILVLSGSNSKAFWDPTFSGCVFDPLGNKIGCAKYTYNEQKNPGSRKRAEDLCNNDLVRKAKGYKLTDVRFNGCYDSGGPHPGAIGKL